MMIDDPRKTSELIADLQNAVPFDVDLSPQLVAMLKIKLTNFDTTSRYAISQVSYAGDAGGIMCRIASDASSDGVVVSLTHLIVRNPLPFANAVAAYQRHRVKKLKKQH
jgi:hypothetical protein